MDSDLSYVNLQGFDLTVDKAEEFQGINNIDPAIAIQVGYGRGRDNSGQTVYPLNAQRLTAVMPAGMKKIISLQIRMA